MDGNYYGRWSPFMSNNSIYNIYSLIKTVCKQGSKRVLATLLVLFLVASVPTKSYAYYQDELYSPSEDASIETLALAGVLDISPTYTFLQPVNDIIIMPGEEISFNILRDEYRDFDFSIDSQNIPEGAAFENGFFHWIPQEDQLGTFKPTFQLTTRSGDVETIAVTIDILSVTEPTEDIDIDETVEEPLSTPFNASVAANNKLESPTGSRTQTVITNASAPIVNTGATTQKKNANDQNTAEEETEKATPVQSVFNTSSATTTVAEANMSISRSLTSFAKTNSTSTISGQTTNNTSSENPITTFDSNPIEIDAPVLDDPGKGSFDGTISLSWSETLSDFPSGVYEVEESSTEDFAAIANTYTVSTNSYTLQNMPTGHYYFRVRALSAPRSQGGLASEDSNVVVISVSNERDIDILQSSTFPNRNIFMDIAGSPGTSYFFLNDQIQFDYDLYDQAEQNFAGLSFGRPNGVSLATMHTLNIRVRGDAAKGYPIRMIIELKNDGQVQGVVFVSNLSDSFQDLTFPIYTESTIIDEVTIVVEDDIDGGGSGRLYIDEFFFSNEFYQPDVVPEVFENAGPGFTNTELLDVVQSDTARFFYDEVIGAGHVKDSLYTNHSSIAATGFGLAVLAIMASRYDEDDFFWNYVTPEMARDRCIAILDDFLRIQGLQATNPEEYGKAGFFYHFINADGTRYGSCEVSVADTALLIVGALVAGEYFGGEVKTKADELYDAVNMDWTFFIDDADAQFHMAWKPESSRNFNVPKDGGYLSEGKFSTSTDEILLITLLALGSHFDNDLVRKSYFSYPRDEKSYIAQKGIDAGREYTTVNSYFGSLFTYLYAHCYFDFQDLGSDETYFAPDAAYPTSINWWDNSVEAFKAHRQFAIDQAHNYPFAYNENSWGFSAVERPDGRYEGRYGAVPFSNGPGHDGVIALYASLSSMPFFQQSMSEDLNANDGFKALRYFYDTYYMQSYGPYGFYESIDNDGNFSNNYLGLDQGPIVLMMENYRTKFVWNTLRENSKIADVLELVYSDGFDYLDVTVKNLSDDTESAQLEFGSTTDGESIVSALHYVEVDFNFANEAAQLVVYTDNSALYTGDDDPAGMVGVDNSDYAAPLQWVVSEVLHTGYNFADNNVDEGIVQDVSDFDFNSLPAINDRTIVYNDGTLAPYPTPGRVALGSRVYLYFGVDYSGLVAQEYRTESLTIEICHVS